MNLVCSCGRLLGEWEKDGFKSSSDIEVTALQFSGTEMVAVSLRCEECGAVIRSTPARTEILSSYRTIVSSTRIL